MNHEEFCEQYGSRPVEVIELGYSDIDQSLFNDFILSISSRYTSKQYDILNNNCNNFSEECAGFLLGKSIPSHILAAPEQLKESCLGQIMLALCALSPLSRTLLLLGVQEAFALIGLSTLASMARDDKCPAAPGDDSAINFGIAIFTLDLAYTTWMMLALVSAVRLRRVVFCVAPFVEALAPFVLGFLGYSACVSISTQHVTLARLFPEHCHHQNNNYALLSVATAFSWLLFLFALVSRLFNQVRSR
mmetsp:Transcript_109714/g.318978  ORF Transcript_109714/g.318978 Transcript_109714/m.318978 type:complete len:247 (+) Transcript_109714:106-846(+)